MYDLSAAVLEATRKAQTLRPNSQLSLVWVSDGIAPIFFEDRDATEEILIRDNVIFNSLTVELRTLFKFLLPIGKPIAGWVGLSLYGSAKHLAQRSGGEAVKVGRVKDYGAGLSRIIGNLTARYSLGFTLAENETDDGRLHQSGSARQSTGREGQETQTPGELTAGLLHGVSADYAESANNAKTNRLCSNGDCVAALDSEMFGRRATVDGEFEKTGAAPDREDLVF